MYNLFISLTGMFNTLTQQNLLPQEILTGWTWMERCMLVV